MFVNEISDLSYFSEEPTMKYESSVDKVNYKYKRCVCKVLMVCCLWYKNVILFILCFMPLLSARKFNLVFISLQNINSYIETQLVELDTFLVCVLSRKLLSRLLLDLHHIY